MADFNNGRPKSSPTTIANFILMSVAVLTLGGGSIAAVVSITTTVGEIRSDVRVLQQQMLTYGQAVNDIRTDVREAAHALRDAQKGK